MVVQTRTSIHILYHSFYFQKICTSLYKYIHCTTVIIFQKYGTGRHADGSSKWLRVGLKMKVNFAFIHSLTQNFVLLFFSLFTKFVVKIKFLSKFSVLANFIENIMKLLFVCVQGHGEEEVSISVVYIYSCFIFSIIAYRRILIISFSLPIFLEGKE